MILFTWDVGIVAERSATGKAKERTISQVQTPELQGYRHVDRNNYRHRPGYGAYGVLIGDEVPKLILDAHHHWLDSLELTLSCNVRSRHSPPSEMQGHP